MKRPGILKKIHTDFSSDLSPVTFTTPTEITDALTDRIRTRLLAQAYRQAEEAQQYVGQKTARVKLGPLVAARYAHGQILDSANIDFRAIQSITEASVKNATDLLEDRVNRNIGEGEELTVIDLTIQQTDLITGTVEGKGWHIEIQMLWNYRYGENSANGVLTVYPQFRGTRHGLPMAGKPQMSKATAAKEAAKAQREAEKNIRRVALRAKFANAPERLARKCEKDINFWGVDHPTAPEWAFIRDAARALTVEQLDEMFAKGDRTAGDIESKLERQFRALATA